MPNEIRHNHSTYSTSTALDFVSFVCMQVYDFWHFLKFARIPHFKFTFREFSRHFCPMQLTVIHTYIHTMMMVAPMQGTDQHTRCSLGFSILPKDTSTCRPGESNQWPSNNKTLALPLIHSRTFFAIAEILPFIPLRRHVHLNHCIEVMLPDLHHIS